MRKNQLTDFLVALFIAAITFVLKFFWEEILSFFLTLYHSWVCFEAGHKTCAAIIIALIVFLITFLAKSYLSSMVYHRRVKRRVRKQFKHSFHLMVRKMLPRMNEMVVKNEPEINRSIDKYIQSPLEYVSEIVKGNQVPEFKADDVYQDIVYDDENEIKYIIAITAENPNLFMDPTIGFYMSNCYAASLLRHVNDYLKKTDNKTGIPQLRMQHDEFVEKVNERRDIVLGDLLATGSIEKGFEFVRFFIYDKEQRECCRKGILPSLKASQDLFRTFSFYLEKEKMVTYLEEDGWNNFHMNNEKIWNLYDKFTENDTEAQVVKNRRIKDTVPEFLFIFYEKMIGIHTYLAGHYWPITVWLGDVKQKNEDNVIKGPDATELEKNIRDLIKALATYVVKDNKKGQLGLDEDEKNKKNTFIDWTWQH